MSKNMSQHEINWWKYK